MIDLAQDMDAVFFGPDFATPMLRQRESADDIEFPAILGVLDEEALDGRALAATRVARFSACHDVRADDLLVTQANAIGVPPGTAFRVLDNPRRGNDGYEMEALLGSVT